MGYESEWTPGVTGDWLGGLNHDSWGLKESNTYWATEDLNQLELNRWQHIFRARNSLREKIKSSMLAQINCHSVSIPLANLKDPAPALSSQQPQSLLKHIHWIKMPASTHLILCFRFSLLPSIFLSIKIFSTGSAFAISLKWQSQPVHWSFQWIFKIISFDGLLDFLQSKWPSRNEEFLL